MLQAFRGHRPQCQQALYLAPSAQLIGQVLLGPGVSVWPGAVLRGDIEPIEIGANSNVQDNAVLHCSHGQPLRVGQNVTLGHGVVIHGCTIQDDVLVGMHATLLNGCVIGRGSIIAAGAVVPEGMVVPPGSMVMGLPAKVRGPVRPEQAQMISKSAQEYLELAQAYRTAED